MLEEILNELTLEETNEPETITCLRSELQVALN